MLRQGEGFLNADTDVISRRYPCIQFLAERRGSTISNNRAITTLISRTVSHGTSGG